MMKVEIVACDRCSRKLGEISKAVVVGDPFGEGTRTADLCKRCLGSFTRWLSRPSRTKAADTHAAAV